MTQLSNSLVITGAKGSQVLAPAEFETGSDRWTRTDSGINGVSPDGKWLAIYRRFSRSLSIYRMPGLEPVAKLTPSANFYVYSFEFSPRGDEVAVGSRWGVEFWSTSTWQRTRAVTNFMRILYTPDARAWWLTRDFFSAGGLYDARTLEPLLLLPYGTVPLALSADGRTLALSVAGRRLQLWNLVEVRQQLRELGLDWDEKLAALKPEK